MTDTKSPAQLTPEQHRVLREHGTERPGSSPLNHEKRPGEFQCAGCGAELFDASTKFDSGTGWPSFWDTKPGAVTTTHRQQPWHGAHRIPLRQMRRPSGPCLQRRPGPDGPALLHEWLCLGFQTRRPSRCAVAKQQTRARRAPSDARRAVCRHASRETCNGS